VPIAKGIFTPKKNILILKESQFDFIEGMKD